MAKKVPMRMCVGCRVMKEKRELVRIVRAGEGSAVLDLTGKLNGRGAYVCPNEQCLARAVKSRALERALETPISAETMRQLSEEIAKRGVHADE